MIKLSGKVLKIGIINCETTMSKQINEKIQKIRSFESLMFGNFVIKVYNINKTVNIKIPKKILKLNKEPTYLSLDIPKTRGPIINASEIKKRLPKRMLINTRFRALNHSLIVGGKVTTMRHEKILFIRS